MASSDSDLKRGVSSGLQLLSIMTIVCTCGMFAATQRSLDIPQLFFKDWSDCKVLEQNIESPTKYTNS